MATIEAVRKANPDVVINALTDESFSNYGQVYTNYEMTALEAFMQSVSIPDGPNIYVPDNPIMAQLTDVQQLGRDIFGGLAIEVGECAGHANALTAMEFHQGSEVNVFFTDVVMVLGKRGQMHNNQFNAPKDAALFYVPAGTVVEFFSDTLHYSPCEVSKSGFKFIVMLVTGSNQPLPAGFKSDNPLLVKTNKFQFVHASRTDKIKQGVAVGLIGDLVTVNPID